jgi:hypothetical protein
VSIFNGTKELTAHLISQYKTKDFKIILYDQTINTVETFIRRGDGSSQIGWDDGILDVTTAVIFPLAFIYGFINKKKKWQNWFCATWIILVILVGIITIDPPWWPRIVELIPPLAILSGSFLEKILQVLSRHSHKVFAGVFVSSFLIFIAIGNILIMFVNYPKQAKQLSVMEPTIIGNFLAKTKNASNSVLFSSGELYLDYDTIRFLAPNTQGCTLTKSDAIDSCKSFYSSKLFIFLPTRIDQLNLVKKIFPNGKTFELGAFDFGNSKIIAYERN